MTLYPQDLIALLLSLAVGGIIGAERELRDKAAGLRTLMFICSGSTLFTIFSLRLSTAIDSSADPTRIAAQIVSGVGFLGAGAILRDGGEVRGLTTASTVWLVAALGVGIGGGLYLYSVAAALIILLVLTLFPSVERMMGRVRQVHTYRILTPNTPENYTALTRLFEKHHLSVHAIKRSRCSDELTVNWIAIGRPEHHEQVISHLLTDTNVKEFDYT